MQAKALTDEELIKNGVSSATSFKNLGCSWRLKSPFAQKRSMEACESEELLDKARDHCPSPAAMNQRFVDIARGVHLSPSLPSAHGFVPLRFPIPGWTRRHQTGSRPRSQRKILSFTRLLRWFHGHRSACVCIYIYMCVFYRTCAIYALRGHKVYIYMYIYIYVYIYM